jgi:hypothetical protein
MKRNDVPILIATAVYSFLFYKQSAGVNYFLFNILLIIFLLIRDIGLLQSRPFLFAAAGCIISSCCVFWYDTTLPFAADMISLILLAGFSFDRSSSIIIAFFHSFYSLIGVVIFFVIDTAESLRTPDSGNGRARLFNKVVLAIVPVIIFLIFFGIYYTGNPIFAKLADQINLDFISIAWCMFTLGGFFFMYGFFKQRVIPAIQDIDHQTGDTLNPVSLDQHVKTVIGEMLSIPSLVYTGVLLLVLLNLLLATVNGLDVYYLGILHTTPPGVTLSEYLHNGTNSLILSIILAVCVILFYFRGYLNFYEGNGWLKKLSYIWIAQNIILVISTAYRNTVYIGDYGLTHKRIGVYVYLFLCIVGLVTTFVKITQGKNNWFLFRRNAWVAYVFMIVSCPVDWDTVITSFDINRFQSDKTMEIDQRYLADLSYTNLAQLFEYYIVEGKTLHYVPATSAGEITLRITGADSHYSNDIKKMIWEKYTYLETRYAPHSWQSHCMSKSNNLHAIERMMKEHNLSCPVDSTRQSQSN